MDTSVKFVEDEIQQNKKRIDILEKYVAPMDNVERINKIVSDYMASNNKRIDKIEKQTIGTLESNMSRVEDQIGTNAKKLETIAKTMAKAEDQKASNNRISELENNN